METLFGVVSEFGAAIVVVVVVVGDVVDVEFGSRNKLIKVNRQATKHINGTNASSDFMTSF